MRKSNWIMKPQWFGMKIPKIFELPPPSLSLILVFLSPRQRNLWSYTLCGDVQCYPGTLHSSSTGTSNAMHIILPGVSVGAERVTLDFVGKKYGKNSTQWRILKNRWAPPHSWEDRSWSPTSHPSRPDHVQPHPVMLGTCQSWYHGSRYLHEVSTAFNHLSKVTWIERFLKHQNLISCARLFYFQTFPRMVHRMRDYSEGETFQKALRFRYICCTSPLMLMCDRTPLPLFLSLIGCSPKYPLTVDIFHKSWKGAYLKYIALWLYKLDTQHKVRETTCSGKKQHAFLGLLVTFTEKASADHLGLQSRICGTNNLGVAITQIIQCSLTVLLLLPSSAIHGYMAEELIVIVWCIVRKIKSFESMVHQLLALA